MKVRPTWQLSIEVNISFDDGLTFITSDFVRRLLQGHPTVMLTEFSDDGAMITIAPCQLENLLMKLQVISTPLCQLSFAVRTVLIESNDTDDEDGILDVGGDDSADSFFTLSAERPIVVHVVQEAV